MRLTHSSMERKQNSQPVHNLLFMYLLVCFRKQEICIASRSLAEQRAENREGERDAASCDWPPSAEAIMHSCRLICLPVNCCACTREDRTVWESGRPKDSLSGSSASIQRPDKTRRILRFFRYHFGECLTKLVLTS